MLINNSVIYLLTARSLSALLRVARLTLTDSDILSPRPAETKPPIASRYDQRLNLKGIKLFPGQVAQAKILYRLRIVCECLRQKYSFLISTSADQKATLFNDVNFFGDDPKIKTVDFEWRSLHVWSLKVFALYRWNDIK